MCEKTHCSFYVVLKKRDNLSELLTAALENMKVLLVTLHSNMWPTLKLGQCIICIKPSRMTLLKRAVALIPDTTKVYDAYLQQV